MDKELFIVATPIGNLQDITLRALEILKSVDVVFCEDTRVTGGLLHHFDIKKKMVSLHQHSDDKKIENLLNENNKIAYVSDAGTPGISDPGNKIVKIAVDLGIKVTPIPGASAVIAGLSVSGLNTDKFLFLGFLPLKGRARVYDLINNSGVLVCFYESPHRILKTLNDLKLEFVKNDSSDRKIVIGRELTKMFESVYRGTIDEVIDQVKDKQKGEFLIIVNPKSR